MAWHQRFFFLLLILLPTQLGFHFWPTWSLVFGRRIDYLSPTLYLSDLCLFLVLLLWVLTKPKIHVEKKFVVGVTLFALINSLFATRIPVSLYSWLKVLEYVCLSYYIIKTKPPIRIFAIGFGVGVFYSSFIAVIQFFLQHSIGGVFWFLGERTFSVMTPGISRLSWCLFFCKELLRAYGTFPHPNVLGGYLAVVLPIIYHFKFTMYKNEKLFFILKTAVIIFGILALFVTFSRSAWIVFGIGMAYVVFGKRKPICFFLCLLVFVIGLFFTLPSLSDESVVNRMELNTQAFLMWQKSPIIGVGLGNFLVNLSSGKLLQPVHNIYLLLLSETGVVGLFGFLWVLWKRRKNVLFLFLLLLGLTDHYLLSLQQGQLLLSILYAFSMLQ